MHISLRLPISLLAVVGLCLSVHCEEAAADGSSLVYNGDFEVDSDADGVPDGWRFGSAGGKGTGSWDGSQYHSANHSLKLQKADREGYSFWESSVDVLPQTKYRISFWYKASGSPGCVLYLNVPYARSTGFDNSEHWQLFEEEFSVGNTNSIRIQFHINAEGSLWLDDVVVAEIGPVSIRPLSSQKGILKLTPEEAEKLLDEAIYVAEETGLSVFTGAERVVVDTTARNGFCARIAGDGPPYFSCQCSFNFDQVHPGLRYDLYGVIKVEKKGNEGTAFRCGVYDGVDRRYVAADMRPPARDVDNGLWSTYKIGTFQSDEGQSVYVGPTDNPGNISEIRVDCFFVVPGSESCKEFWEDQRDYSPTTKFYLRSEKGVSIGLRLKEQKITVGYLISRDERKTKGTFVGLVVDYCAANGYTKRVVCDLGLSGERLVPGESLDVGYGTSEIDEVVRLSSSENLGRYQRLTIEPGRYAPAGWEGEIRLTFALRESPAIFSGMVLAPSRHHMNILGYKVIKGKGDVAFLDGESLDYFRGRVQGSAFQSGLQRLKSLFAEQ